MRVGRGLSWWQLVMIMIPLLRLVCDGNNPNGVWWFCGSHHYWGTQLAAKRNCQVLTDYPGKIVTTGSCLDGASKND